MQVRIGHAEDDPVAHVPDALHRKLKARAAKKGTLSDYLIAELTPIAELPAMDEWLDYLHQPVTFSELAAVTIRKMRESR